MPEPEQVEPEQVEPEQELDTCDHCNGASEELYSVAINRRNTQEWCEECVDHDTFTCRRCDCHYSDDFCEGDSLCQPCHSLFSECSQCGDFVEDYHIVQDQYYCESCEEENCYYCECCGENYPNNNPCDCLSNRLIHDYGYKPKPVFYGKGPMFMGVELELEVYSASRSDVAEFILEKLDGDHVYIKTDGSLSHGLEIVTHPHTLEEHYELWSNWEPPSECKSHNTSTCGLHVHVSREALSPLNIGKILVMINHPNWKQLIEAVAQRSNCQYAKLIPKKSVTHLPNERYEAVNTEPESTIEFRIFKGNLKVDRILKCIEFTHAVCTYAKNVGLKKLHDHRAFVSWVHNNKKSYPHLYSFLKEKNYVSNSSKPNVTTGTGRTENGLEI